MDLQGFPLPHFTSSGYKHHLHNHNLSAVLRHFLFGKHTVLFQETDMQLTFPIIAFTVLINPISRVLGDCVCTHDDNQGSWDDHNSPAVALAMLVVRNGEQYDASVQGHMSVEFRNIIGNVSGEITDCNKGLNIKGCLLSTAYNSQGWEGPWKLYSNMHCEDSDGSVDFKIWD